MEQPNTNKQQAGPKVFNPDDPYGVKAILEEKDRQHQQAMANRPKEASALKWLVIFAPVYLLAAMPFAIWLKDAYEHPDMKLSSAQETAFMADEKADAKEEPVVAPVAETEDPGQLLSTIKTEPVAALTKLFARGNPQQVKDFFDDDAVAEILSQKLKDAGAWDTPEGLLKYLSTEDEGRKI
ncbi:MAG TPA: hypothetical protein PLL10_01440, partial [Elusimicrobiales bacterium]|nr:hypothetical protein [Elusimicrobiales bacterium]